MGSHWGLPLNLIKLGVVLDERAFLWPEKKTKVTNIKTDSILKIKLIRTDSKCLRLIPDESLHPSKKNTIIKKKISPSSIIRPLLRYDEEGRCTNAFEVISNPDILKIAYETIKSKPGNMVRGSDNVTLDGITLKWFDDTSLKLENESYKPKPSRRTYIPKANGKRRPLGISSPRDKIVQQAMRIVMEEILEPRFLDTSHGFRPRRGCHTALQTVRSWKGVPWIIEGDIKSYFDTINHQLLANLLKKHFKEKRLINLYWKLVKAGYIEWENKNSKFVASVVGVPQGSIISPLLSNLVLHELDVYMDRLIKEREKVNSSIPQSARNPKYSSLSYQIRKIKKSIEDTKSNGIKPSSDLRKSLREALIKRRRIKSLSPNPDYLKFAYVRYADDWMVGVWGSKKDAEVLKDMIRNFLSTIHLSLSQEKTLITNTRTNWAKFLGVRLKRLTSNRGDRPINKK